MVIPQILEKALRLYGGKEALICGDRRFTYQAFYDRVKALAHLLANSGVHKEGKVAILHHNCHRFMEVYYAVAQIGAVSVPINYRLSSTEVTPDEKEVGEIIVKGDIVTPGYWKLPEETKKCIIDGWLSTGDLAVMDREGYVTIVDRKKDLIVTGGENVYSTEVENVLYMHPAILEVAVIGVPDETWGEAVKAIVVLKEKAEITEEEIITFCKGRLARYKAPKSVEFVDVLPKTGSGKIAKRELRERYWENLTTRVH